MHLYCTISVNKTISKNGGAQAVYFGGMGKVNGGMTFSPKTLYGFQAQYVINSLANPYEHISLAGTIIHEFLHHMANSLLSFSQHEEFLKPNSGLQFDKGFPENQKHHEHVWIYDSTGEALEEDLGPYFPDALKAIEDEGFESSFDPKQFPTGTPGVAGPDPYAPGELAISVGPTIPDPTSSNGSRARYPNGGPGSCDDPMSCGGGCTVGQAQAGAFATCALDGVAAESGGPGSGTSGKLAGGGWTDPTPLADDNGPIPPCSGAVSDGNSGSGECKAIDCPADNPNCCVTGGKGGAPWALNPAVIMQNCYAQFCGSEQPNCPCGALMGMETFSIPADILMQRGKGPDPKTQPAAQP